MSENVRDITGLCRPKITGAGLPARGEIILGREKQSFPIMISRLSGSRREETRAQPPVLTFGMLEKAFKERNPVTMPAAAFLAGRCETGSNDDHLKLAGLLRDFVNSLDPADPDVLAESYIQTVMSLALMGEKDEAVRLLLPLVTTLHNTMTEGYLAAFYLAQCGEPSGYPAILESLRSRNEHTRLMAMRHMIAFKPFDGQRVRGEKINVVTELKAMLKDPSMRIRREVPYYLAEVGDEKLKEILQSALGDEKNNEVRAAIQYVIQNFASR